MEPTAGTRFERWTVLKDRERGARAVPCRCDCGTEKLVAVGNLKGGASKSCGCLKVDHPNRLTHGAGNYGDYRYRLWKTIRGKCLSPTHQDYAYYGARGITVDPEWAADF